MAKYFAQTNNCNKATETVTAAEAAVIVTAAATTTTTTKRGQHKSLADILTQLAKIVQPFGCVAKRLQSNRQHIYSQFVSKPLPPPLPLSHSSFHLRCPQRYYTWICVHVATAYPTALRDPKCHKYSRIAVANEILPANIAIYSGQQGELCT